MSNCNYLKDLFNPFQPVGDWESGNVTASVGESGNCVCHVYLPDTTFPADRVEHMQQVSKDLIIEVEIQMNKVIIPAPPSVMSEMTD